MKSFKSPRLFKFLFALAMLFVLAKRLHADEATDLLAALKLVRQGDYTTALTVAGKPGSLGYDVVEWQRLRAGKAPFEAYQPFLARRADWPGLPYLRQFGEGTIPRENDASAVVAFFANDKPQTAIGALRYADALMVLGQTDKAKEMAVFGWTEMSLSPDEQAAYLARYGAALADHHTTRLDNLLWNARATEAGRMLDLVDKDWQASANARIALIKGQDNGVNDLIKAVPASMSKGAGLAYARFVYRDVKDNDQGAAELMLERSSSASSLGRPEMWAGKRLAFARMWMRAGKLSDAYALASQHRMKAEGSDYAELEWLSGYLALKLGDPSRALDHFGAFRRAVATPISLGRAGYWEGRALEAMGAKADAIAAYTDGARYQSSFYGQMAAEKAGLPFDPALLGNEQVPDWRGAPFLQNNVVQAAVLLHKAGDEDLAERFARHYAEGVGADTWAQMAQMFLDIGDPHIALSMAKFAADRGVTLPRPYFPVTSLADDKLVVSTPLALAIARRESEFNPGVVSSAGARGLMQVMPATAAKMAAHLGVNYEEAKLLTDPDYNLSLGAAYLDVLIKEFGPNYILVTAGYNAGPGRPRRWVTEFGDPRSGADPIDWIEHVPFDETRNYIMRVIESYVVYQARLEGVSGPMNMTSLLTAS